MGEEGERYRLLDDQGESEGGKIDEIRKFKKKKLKENEVKVKNCIEKIKGHLESNEKIFMQEKMLSSKREEIRK